MKIRTIGNWFLLFGISCLIWSGNSQPLRAGQTYQRQVTVFGNSSAASAAPQAVDPAKEADIRQLMDLVGTKATVMRVMNSMTNDIRPLMLHALPPGQYRERLVQLFFEKFQTKMNPQHFLDLAVPVYAQNFSDDEIKGLIQFYQTPLGKKWISLMPKMQAQILPVAHSWGEELGRQTMLEVLQEHPDLAQDLKAAGKEQAAHAH
jgi:uncharacterized protein